MQLQFSMTNNGGTAEMFKATHLILAISMLGCRSLVGPAAAQTVIDIPHLTESSGIAFSTRTANLLFSHNDSGDSARLFAFDLKGKLEYELEIEKAKSKDWEDMCSFEHDGKNWLAVGDTGDNDFKRESVSIYVLKEPKEKEGDKRRKAEVEYELQVEYPNGAVNSEALAYDPIQHSFLLLSKENLSCVIYAVEIPAEPKKVTRVKAKRVGQHLIPMVTGADISRDGKKLVICTYGPACLIERNTADPKEPWKQIANASAPAFFQVPSRRQGESICFSPQGDRLWLTSEHVPTPLIEVELAKVKFAEPAR